MQDGQYDLNFSAGGYSGRGRAVVDHDTLQGADGMYAFEGTVVDGKAHITSSLNVMIRPEFIRNRHVPSQFVVQLSGMANESGFSLIGTGPLGLIIALEAVRHVPSAGR